MRSASLPETGPEAPSKTLESNDKEANQRPTTDQARQIGMLSSQRKGKVKPVEKDWRRLRRSTKKRSSPQVGGAGVRPVEKESLLFREGGNRFRWFRWPRRVSGEFWQRKVQEDERLFLIFESLFGGRSGRPAENNAASKPIEDSGA